MEFKFLLPTKIPPKYILLFWGKNGRISGIQNEMNLQTVTSDMPHITFMLNKIVQQWKVLIIYKN